MCPLTCCHINLGDFFDVRQFLGHTVVIGFMEFIVVELLNPAGFNNVGRFPTEDMGLFKQGA